jgi:hypothetical protein
MFLVALDILPVQASSVSCERVFSSSKETITTRRSRLSPALMEVLQVLKFIYKQERLDFSSDWISDPNDLLWIPDVTTDVARNLLADGKFNELADSSILNSSNIAFVV